ncbi:MAG: ABC transporter ATP-binding protein [Dehalococcoidia bacterium]
MDTVISVRGLCKNYRTVRALDGVDLDVAAGEVFALLGPNGAGKTTFIEILEGYRQRSGGDARVLDADPGRADAAWRARVGIVLQSSGMFDELTVGEVVSHFGEFYPRPLRADHVLGLVGLEGRRDARCKSLSGGQRRRVDLALGLIGNPDLIFLDEPTTGFDPAARRQAWDVIRQLAMLGKTVLLTTHYLDEAEALAHRVGVIVAGRLTAVGAPAELAGRERGRARIRFRLEGALTADTMPELREDTTVQDGLVSVLTAAPTRAVTVLSAWCRARGQDELPGLSITRPSLEDVYLAMIGGEGETTPARDNGT